ncbi:MAG: hypothetical protein ACRCXZ_00855 [Patescibacteria group bacterium]
MSIFSAKTPKEVVFDLGEIDVWCDDFEGTVTFRKLNQEVDIQEAFDFMSTVLRANCPKFVSLGRKSISPAFGCKLKVKLYEGRGAKIIDTLEDIHSVDKYDKYSAGKRFGFFGLTNFRTTQNIPDSTILFNGDSNCCTLQNGIYLPSNSYKLAISVLR